MLDSTAETTLELSERSEEKVRGLDEGSDVVVVVVVVAADDDDIVAIEAAAAAMAMASRGIDIFNEFFHEIMREPRSCTLRLKASLGTVEDNREPS